MQQNKLQELTDKIYQEGLEKGNQEAKAIVDKANEEAKSIVESAKKDAEQILNEAKKKAEETLKNTESEIKLSSKQALIALKQEITDVINNSIIGSATGNAFDVEFTKKMVETTLSNWSKEQSADMSVILPQSQEEELTAYFTKSVKDMLDKGVELKFDPSIKSGFQVSPKDGGYKVSFTDEDFSAFFKQYLRPKLIDILFE